jgi:hypothetical protein
MNFRLNSNTLFTFSTSSTSVVSPTVTSILEEVWLTAWNETIWRRLAMALSFFGYYFVNRAVKGLQE